MKVILVHGINTKEGMANVGRLKPFIERRGMECVLFEYGYLGAWRARWSNSEMARRLAHLVTPGDAVIGHSNGCAIIYLAAKEQKAKFGRVALINPALDADRKIAADQVDVYHNAGDDVVWASKLLLWHPWGEMGRCGADGDWANNFDCGRTPGMPKVYGHSDIFTNRCLRAWGDLIAARMVASS